ncbi:slipin family protein [Hymenobacter sp. NST-14]|uniref:slipin family protein n=1 Tax=Hymenobacter piscis TaxID=2839984 RepID=UPI001C02E6DE|nr:slipin family protein [Hymenobacter piscis]MBT9395218.1 slipin family protein [Hymenobacter piscis]
MGLLTTTYQVKPNQEGFLFRDNVLERRLAPGRYEIWDLRRRTLLLTLPTTSRLLVITNQEVLTKDSIALRFSFTVLYRIADGARFLSQFELNQAATFGLLQQAEQRIQQAVQVAARNRIAGFQSEELPERRDELTDFTTPELLAQLADLGVVLEQAQLRDLTFPKSIQDLFSRHLEAKIRAKADLENARTAVATARALKNAADLMKGDDSLRFFQYLETITKIAAKGKHTFLVGDFPALPKG